MFRSCHTDDRPLPDLRSIHGYVAYVRSNYSRKIMASAFEVQLHPSSWHIAPQVLEQYSACMCKRTGLRPLVRAALNMRKYSPKEQRHG